MHWSRWSWKRSTPPSGLLRLSARLMNTRPLAHPAMPSRCCRRVPPRCPPLDVEFGGPAGQLHASPVRLRIWLVPSLRAAIDLKVDPHVERCASSMRRAGSRRPPAERADLPARGSVGHELRARRRLLAQGGWVPQGPSTGARRRTGSGTQCWTRAVGAAPRVANLHSAVRLAEREESTATPPTTPVPAPAARTTTTQRPRARATPPTSPPSALPRTSAPLSTPGPSTTSDRARPTSRRTTEERRASEPPGGRAARRACRHSHGSPAEKASARALGHPPASLLRVASHLPRG